MADNGWTVEQVEAGVLPVWGISCPECLAGTPALCRTEEAQAVAWARSHHVTPRTVVGVWWPDSRPSADWVYGAVADIVLAAALPVPGVLGAETGNAGSDWTMGIYGRTDAGGLDRLQRSIRAGFDASPFVFADTDQSTVRPISDREYDMSEMLSNYRKYVAWNL